jgi:hypothetical protein
MNNVKQQELGNELQSSQHLRLQSASCKLLDSPTVPVGASNVQFKKRIGGIVTVGRNKQCRASLDRTAGRLSPRGNKDYVIRSATAQLALPAVETFARERRSREVPNGN